MDFTELIPLVIKISIILIVFSLGLRATPEEVTFLFRRPGLLLRSLLAMNIVMPLFAVAVAVALNLNPAVEIALVALAVSPVPPMLLKKQLKAGGEASYAVGLFVAAALLSIVFVPVAVDLLGKAFSKDAQISLAAVAQVVLITVLVPLVVGLIARRVAPGLAERTARPISLVATVLLVVSVLPILFTAWRAIISLIGNGTLLVIAAFVLVGLGIGHLLGGPDQEDRTVLALSTACRHPGVALAIVIANFPGQKLVPAAILLYLIVSAIVSIPYLKWRRCQHAGIEAKTGVGDSKNFAINSIKNKT